MLLSLCIDSEAIYLIYLMRASLFVSSEDCSPACMNGGICNDGICECGDNWEGDHCQTRK